MTHFQRHEQRDTLERVVPAVDVIPHEEVVRIRTRAAYPEELQEVVKLSVNVATDRDGTLDWLDIRLAREDLLGFLAQLVDLCLGQVLGASQAVDLRVQRLHLAARVHSRSKRSLLLVEKRRSLLLNKSEWYRQKGYANNDKLRNVKILGSNEDLFTFKLVVFTVSGRRVDSRSIRR
uniref:Uncharacterized protein n=1 Tax=Hyaloperonospora arabidopsidis (strain Emoy2) TaxID=559515 RepID=M4C2T4_HYAAE